ncbi:MAG: hypothetical protein M0Q51_00835 [Bacteroidales bacterium]|nr:hypothetical protein [Bacteroidales bacterium]
MDTIEILKTAIEQRKPISFQYNAADRAVGIRFGNPHAIFIASTDNVNIHIWKTGGVSSDLTKPLPAWREYKIKHIIGIKIIEDQGTFELADGYKPNSPMYKRAIARA